VYKFGRKVDVADLCLSDTCTGRPPISTSSIHWSSVCGPDLLLDSTDFAPFLLTSHPRHEYLSTCCWLFGSRLGSADEDSVSSMTILTTVEARPLYCSLNSCCCRGDDSDWLPYCTRVWELAACSVNTVPSLYLFLQPLYLTLQFLLLLLPLVFRRYDIRHRFDLLSDCFSSDPSIFRPVQIGPC